MTDITDTLILIQIKSFIQGQRSAALHTTEVKQDPPPSVTLWMTGYQNALADLATFIDDLQAKANKIQVDAQMAFYPTVRAWDAGDEK